MVLGRALPRLVISGLLVRRGVASRSLIGHRWRERLRRVIELRHVRVGLVVLCGAALIYARLGLPNDGGPVERRLAAIASLRLIERRLASLQCLIRRGRALIQVSRREGRIVWHVLR